MQKTLFAAGATVETMTEIQQVWDATLETLGSVGIDIAIYLSSDAAIEDIRVLSNAPAIHADAPPAEDPFLEWCCRNYEVNLTGVAFVDDYPYLPAEAKAFIRAAAEHGFRSGVAIPTRLSGSARFGGFNLGTGLDRAAFESLVVPHVDALRFFCLIVHRKLEELGFDTAPTPTDASAVGSETFRARLLAPPGEALDSLSPREREVIYLQAQGMARKEVARMCGISPNTVAEYTSKAYRKLGINNRAQAARLVFGR